MPQIALTFDSAGLTIAGMLYLPDSPAGRRLPAIVVGHQGGAVKEQAAGLYAAKLAAAGFAALVFDAAYQGESGGEPRGLEDPAHRVEDIKAAVSLLTTRPEVDPDRIGALGICASGGYALAAASTDRRVRAVATVSAADIGRYLRLGPDGTQDPAVFTSMLDAAADARTRMARGEKSSGMPLFPDTIEQARELGGDHAAEGFEYYRTPRAQHPRSAECLEWTSIDRIAAFDAFTAVPLLGARALLMIVGTRAVTSWMSLEAYHRATGPKRIHWIEGASHADLYDREQYVGSAVDELASFFEANLPRD
ncbi:alpha/beta hydrolase [Nocardia alni]|uniref:alpha/beta hydrolase n=1 Tax=Nocardia alni TaxID=2815723 RepID=UPI001C2146FD|nr:alpha/beta hydrolase [Nocardia alni]